MWFFSLMIVNFIPENQIIFRISELSAIFLR